MILVKAAKKNVVSGRIVDFFRSYHLTSVGPWKENFSLGFSRSEYLGYNLSFLFRAVEYIGGYFLGLNWVLGWNSRAPRVFAGSSTDFSQNDQCCGQLGRGLGGGFFAIWNDVFNFFDVPTHGFYRFFGFLDFDADAHRFMRNRDTPKFAER